MICLPPPLTPSSLLYCRGMAQSAERLSKECLEISAEGELKEIEQLALNAEELHKKKGDWLGCATALLRLGDRCRQVGELGPAREYCEQARRLFSQHSFKPEQRHNEAVATYTLGLVNQLLGDGQEALYLYEQAQALFERAKRHWRVVGNKQLDKKCELASLWINKLMEYISDVLSRGDTTALQYSVFICPWPSDINRLAPLLADLDIEECTIAQRGRMGDKDFELCPINGMTLTLKRGEEYYVVEVPKQGVPDLSVQEGDYVLVQQAGEIRRAGRAMNTEKEPLFYQFVRQADGSVQFIPVDPDEPPRIIPDDLLTGTIVGYLKPA